MADTYYVGTELVTPVGSVERLAPDPNGEYNTVRGLIGPTGYQTAAGAATTGQYVEHGAWYALYNAPGSGKKINILNLSLVENQARRGTTATVAELYRTTSDTGGVEVPVTCFDSDSYDIQPQMKFRINCDLPTTTGSQLREILDLQKLTLGQSVAYPNWARPSGGRLDNSVVWDMSGLSEIQPLTLREGQGIALVVNTGGGGVVWPLALTVLFNIGTVSYIMRQPILFQSVGALFSMFNGIGSNRTITVLNISVTEITDVQTAVLPYVEVATVSGLHPNSLGLTEPVLKLDSNSPDLPPHIQSCQKAGVFLAHSSSFIISSGMRRRGNEQAIRQVPLAPYGHFPGAATPVGFGLIPGTKTKSLLDFTYRNRSSTDWPHQLTLREGEGIAIVQPQGTSGRGQGFWMDLLFTVEDAANRSAVGPVINGGFVRVE